MIRLGNAYVEHLTYSLSHGTTASTAEGTFESQAALLMDGVYLAYIGGSLWRGIVRDIRDIKNEGVGLVTSFRAVDYRDELGSDVFFGQINMIDKNTGEIYSISEIDNPNGWIEQVPVVGHIYPKTLLEDILSIKNFTAQYTTAALNVLRDASVGWLDNRYNLFNLDWNSGVKLSAAVAEICSRLGIQPTIRMDTVDPKILHFSVIGEPNYPFLEWEGIFANESEVGNAVQADVDTGVYITGDRQLWQFADRPIDPAWNQNWNQYYWDTMLLEEKCDALGIDPMVDQVVVFAAFNAAEGDFNDHGFVEANKFFNNMTIMQYIRTVPFKVYRIRGMDSYLNDDELNGLRPVYQNPIVTPLLSDPGTQYTVKATSINLKTKKVKNPLQISTTTTEHHAGVRLLESSGHVVFDRPQFKITPEAIAENKIDLEMEDLIPDTPTITCVFVGPVYREFFGTTTRVGVKQVAGLRIAKIIADPFGVPDDYAEYVLPGEKSASQVAYDVALGYLARPRIVRSGSETFKGHAGHVPTGEIQRVSVSVDPRAGISESVTYSNDEPSIDYDPQIEQRRRISLDHLKREQERIRSDRKNRELGELRSEANGKLSQRSTHDSDDVLTNAALEGLNRDNWLVAKNLQRRTYQRGEPIFGYQHTDGQFVADTDANINDGAKKVLGVMLRSTHSTTKVPVVVHGMAHARVVGPVVVGDSLIYDKPNVAFKKGDGGTVLVMTDQPSGTPTMTPVRIGGGGGGTTSAVEVNAATTANLAAISGLLTIDGYVTVNADRVLVKNQDNPILNDIYTVNSAGAWTRTGELAKGLTVVVRGGNTNIGKSFICLNATVTPGTTQNFFRAAGDDWADCASTGNLALSGTPTVDGQTTAGKRVLVKNQTTTGNNGLYEVTTTGVWFKIGQPQYVCVKAGTQQGRCWFILTAANVYSSMGAFWL